MNERFDPQVRTHLAAFLRVEPLTRLPETHGLGCEKDSFVLLKKTIEREANLWPEKLLEILQPSLTVILCIKSTAKT